MGQSFKRKVFYIPGYDIVYPRRYRELYRTESAAQGPSAAMTSISVQKTGRVVMAGSGTVRLTADPHAQTSK